MKRTHVLVLVASVLVAAVLRFTWNADMEFKGDESWMFERAVHVGRTEPWPTLGMTSGVGLRNPGLSVWAFVALARLFHVSTPLELDRVVVLLNVAAFALLALFIVRCVDEDEREPWIWGLALAAVNPVGLLLQRKIWAQSLFPFVCVVMLWGWWRRDRRGGAFVWGLVGACLGQIHMSGFFFAFAFFVATVWSRRPARWGAWLAGSTLGAVSLLPWVKYVLTSHEARPPWQTVNVTDLRFPTLAFSNVLGLGLDYSLGGDYPDFLRSLGYVPTVARALALVCGMGVLVFALRHVWSRRAERRTWLAWPKRATQTALAAFAALPVYGVVLTLGGAFIYRHYLHVDFPFEGVLLALVALRCAPRPRAWLVCVWLSSFALSVAYLDYIHVHGGAQGGDYGRAYRGP